MYTSHSGVRDDSAELVLDLFTYSRETKGDVGCTYMCMSTCKNNHLCQLTWDNRERLFSGCFDARGQKRIQAGEQGARSNRRGSCSKASPLFPKDLSG